MEDNKIDGDNYSIDDFQKDIDYGKIQINYDTLNTENENIRVSENMLYYYIDHIIFKLEDYIDDIDMLYLRNDTETPLEALLIKMIRYFKSLTVDLLGLDLIFICDFKNENILRLFDEIPYMKKLIQVGEHFNFKLSDVVTRAIAEYKMNDTLKMRDMFAIIAYLYCIDRTDILFNGDAVRVIEKYIQAGAPYENRLGLFDAAHMESEVDAKDKLHLRDKIVAKWYSD